MTVTSFALPPLHGSPDVHDLHRGHVSKMRSSKPEFISIKSILSFCQVIADCIFEWARELGAIDFAHWFAGQTAVLRALVVSLWKQFYGIIKNQDRVILVSTPRSSKTEANNSCLY